MRQHEQLLDVVAWNFRIQVLGIVPADVDHLTDDCTDEEQGCAIHEDCIFVKVGKALHYIDTEYQVVNKLTGEAHPTAGWLVDVLKG